MISKDKLIGILGAGKSGVSCAKLALSIGYQVILSDASNNVRIDIEEHEKLIIEKGFHSNKLLECSCLIISPGIPNDIAIVKEATKNNIPIISEIEFASWFTNSDILAVTGSNGKSTTVSILHQILLKAGYNSFLGGNIGVAFSENLLHEKSSVFDKTVHVLELSSFQIERLNKFKSKISCILNISEDHLDRYKNMNDYIRAKLNISDFSQKIIYNSDDEVLNQRFKKSSNAIPIIGAISNYEIINNSIFNKKTKKGFFHLKKVT